ncbi:MAG: efflux RND transporter periplasmic adaptor subunit [Verrucomicrobia bacterium]|nr:efflux RND transporter periplasmic adaptor subunit [Verrucomicrobiota bacterium]
MTKRIVLTVLIALVVFGAIFGYKFYSISKMMAARAGMQMPPVTVSVASVQKQTWPNMLTAVGSLASYRGITVKTELEGPVREIVAQSGAVVAQGDLLVVLDTAMEEAQLSGLEAQAKLAEINLTRARELRTNGTNTPSDLDGAEASSIQSKAAVSQLRVTLAKKRIVAPFAGRLGIVKVYPGQFLSKGDSLVVLECIDPIHVDFSLPQQDLSRLAVDQIVNLKVDAFPGRVFEAKITAISPRISDATRSVDVRATLENKDEALRPGMYARVEALLPPTENALVLPGAAVVHNPYGETVYVIDNGLAKQRFIKTGPQRGDLILVTDGLKEGDQVVTAGQIKLRNGSAVRIDNSAAPEANPAPKPNES